MKRTKEQSGITLIALVITIIVLLILAAVTITYILSDGGVFKAARETRIEQEAGLVRDYVTSAQGAAMIEYYNPKYTENGSTASVGVSRATIDITKIIQDSFPQDIYTIKPKDDSEDNKAKYSTTAYDSRIVSGTYTITSTRTPDVEFTLEFHTDGVARVSWAYKEAE